MFCVVRNHQILYVDLVGTCYDVLNKPMPLMQRHVDIYRHKVIMGIHNRLRRDKNGDLNQFGDATDRISDGNSLVDFELN